MDDKQGAFADIEKMIELAPDRADGYESVGKVRERLGIVVFKSVNEEANVTHVSERSPEYFLS